MYAISTSSYVPSISLITTDIIFSRAYENTETMHTEVGSLFARSNQVTDIIHDDIQLEFIYR